ncbi:hypothetical protein L7F22_049203 [Adiantum nelumboides]|nr:hypothetical protein [Adiantum nelumboides]
MQQEVDETLAEEAARNYDKDTQQTIVKWVVLKATKPFLTKALDLPKVSQGDSWTPKMVTKHLRETEEEKNKRKKGAQVIKELIPKNPVNNSADLQYLCGKWRLVWSSQAADANWLQKATTVFPSWQVVEAETGRLQNLVEFLPGVRLRARARSEAISAQRRDVNFEGAALEV